MGISLVLLQWNKEEGGKEVFEGDEYVYDINCSDGS